MKISKLAFSFSWIIFTLRRSSFDYEDIGRLSFDFKRKVAAVQKFQKRMFVYQGHGENIVSKRY